MPRPRPSVAPTSAVVLPRAWGWSLVAIATAYVIAYLAVALARLGYPYELEWIEGGILQTMGRVLAGRPLYAEPSLDYIAFNYPPLYPWAAAGLAHLVGDGFQALRLTSLLASLGVFALVGGLVWSETRNAFASTIAVGLMAATYRISGAWFDVGRADSLYLLLVIAAFAVLRLDGTRVRAPVVSGVLWTLAFLTKQSAVMVGLPIVVFVLWKDRLRGAVLATTMAAGMIAVTLWLDAASHGWYRYFLFEASLRHPMDPGLLLAFWPHDIVRPLGIALLIGAACVLRGTSGGRGMDVALFVGASLSAWFHRSYPGGYDNVLMPAFAATAILFGLGWHALRTVITEQSAENRSRWINAMCLAAALQFVALAYDPRAQIPRAADREAGDRLVERLHAVPGRVLIPSHPYLVERAGKPDHFHEMALIALIEYANGEREQRIRQRLEAAVRDTTWSVVILSTRGWLGSTIRTRYDQAYVALPDPDVFWPVTGMRTRPEYVFVPRRSP